MRCGAIEVILNPETTSTKSMNKTLRDEVMKLSTAEKIELAHELPETAVELAHEIFGRYTYFFQKHLVELFAAGHLL